MKPRVEMDRRGFSRAVKDIARFSGVEVSHVVKSEAQAILKKAMSRTKVASVEQVDIASRKRTVRAWNKTASDTVSVNSGTRGAAPFGRVWVKSRQNPSKFRYAGKLDESGAWEPSGWHFTDEDWSDVEEIKTGLPKDLKLKRKEYRARRGLARQSWLQAMQDLGVAIGGGQAAKAKVNGREIRNGRGYDTKDAKSYTVTIENGLPYGKKIKLDRILLYAIRGRINYYNQNMRKGVFTSLEQIKRKYPGII